MVDSVLMIIPCNAGHTHVHLGIVMFNDKAWIHFLSYITFIIFANYNIKLLTEEIWETMENKNQLCYLPLLIN